MQKSTLHKPQPQSPRPFISGNVTIHRLTGSHHGRTLRTLGHAAEYLIISRAVAFGQPETRADKEAVRILMQLSRCVFEEYAERSRQPHPIADWIMNQAVRVYGAA